MTWPLDGHGVAKPKLSLALVQLFHSINAVKIVFESFWSNALSLTLVWLVGTDAYEHCVLHSVLVPRGISAWGCTRWEWEIRRVVCGTVFATPCHISLALPCPCLS